MISLQVPATNRTQPVGRLAQEVELSNHENQSNIPCVQPFFSNKTGRDPNLTQHVKHQAFDKGGDCRRKADLKEALLLSKRVIVISGAEAVNPSIIQQSQFLQSINRLAGEGRLLRHYALNIDCTKQNFPELNQRTVQLHGHVNQEKCGVCSPVHDSNLYDFLTIVNLTKGKGGMVIDKFQPSTLFYVEEEKEILAGIEYDLRKEPDLLLLAGTNLESPGNRLLAQLFCDTVHKRLGGLSFRVNKEQSLVFWRYLDEKIFGTREEDIFRDDLWSIRSTFLGEKEEADTEPILEWKMENEKERILVDRNLEQINALHEKQQRRREATEVEAEQFRPKNLVDFLTLCYGFSLALQVVTAET